MAKSSDAFNQLLKLKIPLKAWETLIELRSVIKMGALCTSIIFSSHLTSN